MAQEAQVILAEKCSQSHGSNKRVLRKMEGAESCVLTSDRPHLNQVEEALLLDDQGRDVEQDKSQLMSPVRWELNAVNLQLQEVICLAYTVFGKKLE